MNSGRFGPLTLFNDLLESDPIKRRTSRRMLDVARVMNMRREDHGDKIIVDSTVM